MQTKHNLLAQADQQMKRLLSVGSADNTSKPKGLYRMSRIIAVCFWALFMMFVTNSYAAEQRCTELGANCICSEPLNTTTYTNPVQVWAFNAGDSTTKECNNSGIPGTVFERVNGEALFGDNASSVMNALPAGHTNSYVLRGPEGMTGQLGVGSYFSASDPRGRRSMRVYLYYSPNFIFTDDGTGCANSGKSVLFSYGPVGVLLSHGGNWQVYSWGSNFSVPGFPDMTGFDCCTIGPGQDAAFTALTLSDMKGRWWRIEAIMRNQGNVPTILQIYMKDVTNNGPEYKVVDTSIPQQQNAPNNWTSTEANGLGSTLFNDGPTLDLFRRDAGFCPGFNALSHILYAAWTTDAGQRIGAAYEIEGGSGSLTPPNTPGALIVQ